MTAPFFAETVNEKPSVFHSLGCFFAENQVYYKQSVCEEKTENTDFPKGA